MQDGFTFVKSTGKKEKGIKGKHFLVSTKADNKFQFNVSSLYLKFITCSWFCTMVRMDTLVGTTEAIQKLSQEAIREKDGGGWINQAEGHSELSSR